MGRLLWKSEVSGKRYGNRSENAEGLRNELGRVSENLEAAGILGFEVFKRTLTAQRR
jgi:hypothetical protein